MVSSLWPCSTARARLSDTHSTPGGSPSKLFWQAASIIASRSRLNLHYTYRAVGSSTGQKEFVGPTDEASDPRLYALTDFGAGDIPMTAERYAQITTEAQREMLHVPFALGAIGVFHNVPDSALGGEPLSIDGCTLAKIFSRQITDWSDAELKEANPSFTGSGAIKVAHRHEGSSSTAGFTEYLSKHAAEACPEAWPLEAGALIAWPEDTYAPQGSGGMAKFIGDNLASIGYIDIGHGHKAGLGEIELQNRDGNFLLSTAADISSAGAVALAQTPSPIPASATASWADVNLYDYSGPTTWPITMISCAQPRASPPPSRFPLRHPRTRATAVHR